MEGGVASALPGGLVIGRTAPAGSLKHHQPSPATGKGSLVLVAWFRMAARDTTPTDFPLEHREFASLLHFNYAAFASSGGILQLARRISLFTKELFFFSAES